MRACLIKKMIAPIVLIVICCVGWSCNSIPNETNQIKSIFYPELKEKYDRDDTLIVFNPNRNHTVDLSGTRSFTYSRNGEPIIKEKTDSIFGKIISRGDVLLNINDSIYGSAKFEKADIMNWPPLVTFIRDTNCLLGNLLFNNLNPSKIDSIVACTSSIDLLTDTLKGSIIETFNNFINMYDFYFEYKDKIISEIALIQSLVDSLNVYVNYLIKKDKLLNKKGKVIKKESSLTNLEVEKLKWFQKNLITKFIGNANVIPGNAPVFTKYSSKGQLYSLKFQLYTDNNRINDNEITRYFEIKNSALSQLAFITKTNKFLLDNKKTFTNFIETKGDWKVINSGTLIHKHPYKTIDDWNVTPLFWEPDVSFLSKDDIYSLLLPGNATVELTKYSSVSLDTLWFDMKFYYTLSGSIKRKNEHLNIIGNILLTIGFYKTIENPAFGSFTHWNSYCDIQAKNNKGETQKHSEKCLMKCKSKINIQTDNFY